MEISNNHVEAVIWDYVDRYVQMNHAASTVQQIVDGTGIGLRPILDHLSIRTKDIGERAHEFEALGYVYDDRLGVMEHDAWWAKVYRKPGFPAVYLDQAFEDVRGTDSVISRWVDAFSDGQLHHIGVCVDRLEVAIERLSRNGIEFSGEIIGDADSEFRQVYTAPEVVDGMEFSVFELVERRWGYAGFLSPTAKVK